MTDEPMIDEPVPGDGRVARPSTRAGAREGREASRLANAVAMFARVVVALAVCLALCPASLHADGPAFRIAEPGYTFRFPRDHGSHPEYRTEWWYTTGHLTTESGRKYGFEVTFFRVGVDPRVSEGDEGEWSLRQLGLAHFAITDVDEEAFRYYEKLNRFSPFTANAAVGRLDVFNEGWTARMDSDGSIRLRASEDGDAIDLVLRPRKAPVIHGENGISVKAEGEGYASHYYSLTRLDVSGTIRTAGRNESCIGLAWFDHEFGSSELREYQSGWDWFSIQLDSDTELMLYVIRRKDGTPDVTSSGSFVLSDGTVVPLRRGDYRIEATGRWTSPETKATYPMGWKITVPSVDLDLDIRPVLKNQELVTSASTRVTYWEGAVDVDGRQGSSAVTGVGYVEMTGYDRAEE